MDVTGGTPAPSAPASITLATLGEVLAYGGAAAALAAAGIVVAQRSNGSTGVLLATFGVSALALLAVGWVAGDNEDPRRRRIRAVLWWLSLNAAEEFIGVLLVLEVKMGIRGALVLTGVLSCLYGLALWLVCKSVLQQLGLFIALIITVVAVTFPSAGSFGGGRDVSLIAVALLVLGGVWFFLGQVGVVAPRRTARVLGSLLLLFAPYLFVANNGTSALFLIAIIAAVLLVVGEIVHDAAVVGIGIAGIVVGAAAAVGATAGVGSSTESLAILIGGVVALAASILLLRTGEPSAPAQGVSSPPPAPPQPQEPTAPPTPPME